MPAKNVFSIPLRYKQSNFQESFNVLIAEGIKYIVFPWYTYHKDGPVRLAKSEINISISNISLCDRKLQN